MALRLIGTGTTDTNGRVSITYTGKGAGKLQLVAKNGSLQSETYVVTDAIFYDSGLTDATTKWSYPGSDFTHEITTEGISITNSASSGNKYLAPKVNGSNINMSVTEDFIVEYDIKNNTVDSNIITGVIGTNFGLLSRVSTSSFTHLKFVKTGTSVSLYINDNTTATETRTITAQSGDISLGLTPGNLVFRNFTVYPI